MGEYHGHKTMTDGRCIPLSKAEADAIWAKVEEQRVLRATNMPTEKEALEAMFQAFQRLKELGWREAIYCPKDGSTFKVIEPGSTGIFDCYYQGEWPTGSFWLMDDSDLWPSRPILFKPNEPKEVKND